MVYDQTLTYLAQVIFPTFAAVYFEFRKAHGSELLPGAVTAELETRIVNGSVITKDQLLNLAAELLPAESLRELLGHRDVISGIAEWDQIRFRRRRAILDLATRYFASSRLTTGTLVSPESLALHRFDLEQMERKTYIVSYTCRFIADPLRTSCLTELEAMRALFYAEDRVLNLATYQWDLTYNRVRSSD